MNYFDLHCDTLDAIAAKGGTLRENSHHLDLRRLNVFEKSAVCFAVFTEPELRGEVAADSARRLLEIYLSELEKNSDIAAFCKSAKEIESANKSGKTACLLTVENSAPFEKDEKLLEEFICKGACVVSLTHNFETDFAGGAESPQEIGLTSKGKEFILYLLQKGVAIDISHLNFKSCYELLEFTDAPVIATHSNCFEICGNGRNLKEDMVKEIFRRKGIIGINLHTPFVGENGLDDLILHIERFTNLGGENFISLGCDFDGTDRLIGEINNVSNLPKLADKLALLGYTDLIDKLFYSNAFDYMARAGEKDTYEI